ncbi:sterol-4-alpha-carboxylate 3-dehydrogenase (decarboxylating) [Rhodotorula paludigena]|uniref:sterol-4-alpha-carboxylate 3-dehydrogenase (decarboxylating) n=1 Tax=Rhodotorula paludigena TaxID=86838 RepID=UPI003179C969
MSESYLVIGGEGFVGHRMVEMLLERYPSSSVASLDLVQRHFPDQLSGDKRKWTFYSADLTSLDSLATAIRWAGATTVFHTASPWTGSGKDVCEKVNVQGTQTVVDACVQEGVKKLVFTSSAGTVYEGTDLINVDERLPFPKTAIDPYNETKAKAETIVLEANGKGGLLTVALRPAGIFGPGDRQAVPGFVEVLKSGKTKFQVGDNRNLFDWTYVDNVVHAHLVASERLGQTVSPETLDSRIRPVDLTVPRRRLPTSVYRPESLLAQEKKFDPSFANDEKGDAPLLAARNRFDQYFAKDLEERLNFDAEGKIPIAGQAYFITNGEPVTFWDFARALWNGYNGHVAPWVVPVPAFIALAVAGVAESVMWVFGKTPNMTQGKVVYSTVNRFYNIEKSRRILGYEPIVGLEEGIKRAITWYKENEASLQPKKA